MCKKYIGLLLFVVATMMFAGCAEDPYDWSGDSARPVPIPKELEVKLNDGVLEASCQVEQHDDDLPILECGFFYGFNESVTYNTGKRIKSEVADGWMNGSQDGIENKNCYVGAYITTSRGTKTVGPQYVEDNSIPMPKPKGLKLSYNKPFVKATCNIDYDGTTFPIKEVGFYYGTYASAVSYIKCEVVNNSFQASIPVSGWSFCYVYAVVQSSKGRKKSETVEIRF